MAVDHIRYDILAQEALRGVVRTVLADAARNGLPGDHHFYITFSTSADGVHISARLREQYPQEMTIILQHQFWDLTVSEDAFEVGLSFGGIPERLRVPFHAVKAFFDPSVQFGLQFELVGQAEATAPVAERPEQQARPPAEQQPPRVAPKSPAGPVPVPANPAAGKAGTEPPDEPPPPTGGEVVRLDRFRKK